MIVSFYDAEMRGRYYFPGFKQWGIVKGILGVRKRIAIVVKMDKGATDVLLRSKDWVADTEVNRSRPSAPIPPVIAASERQVVGLKNTKVLTRISGKRRSRDKLVRIVTVPAEASILDTRPVPDIPGPPVPKPLRGVWDRLEIACLRSVQ